MPTAFEGFKQGGNTIPVKDAVAQNGVIANTKLIKDTVGFSGKNFNKGNSDYVFVKSTARTQIFQFAKNVTQGKKYTVSFDVSAISGYTGNMALGVRFIDSDTAHDWNVSTSASGRISHTFTASSDAPIGGTNSVVYMFISSTEGDNATITISNLMFTDADILDQTYEPYHSQSVEDILLEKGVIDGDVPLTNFEQGAISGPGNTTTTYSQLKVASTTRIRTTDVVSVPSGTWKLSVNFDSYEVNAIAFNSAGTAIYPVPQIYNVWSSKDIVIDTTGNVKGIAIAIRRKDGADITTDELSSINPRLYSQCLKDSMFPRDEQRLLGARNLWDEDALYFTALGGTVTKTDGITNIQVTATGENSGAYIPTARFTANLSDFVGRAGYLSLDIKADKSCSCKVGIDRTAQTINTEWKHVEQYYKDISIIPEYDIYNMDGSTPTISAKNFMIRFADDLDNTYTPYIPTNKQLKANKAENSVVGAVENGANASQNYTIGQHFIRNGKFCTAKAWISSGTALTKDTNYVEGDIAKTFITDTEKTSWVNSVEFTLQTNSEAILFIFGGTGASYSSIIPIGRVSGAAAWNTNLVPSGVTITSDANGVITVSGTDTFLAHFLRLNR